METERPNDTDFVLADRERIVTARGVRRRHDDLDAARRALRSRPGPLVGAIAFDPETPDVLWEPEHLDVRAADRTCVADPARECPAPDAAGCVARPVDHRPAPDLHRERIASVVELIRGGVAEKVVLGRAEALEIDPPLGPLAALEGFRSTDPAGNGYLVRVPGGWLVGSSPELLVALDGDEVTAFPLAGTCSRSADPSGRVLLDSVKDLDEHAFVSRSIAEALAPLCAELDVPATPELVPTPTTWHLGTRIRGRLRAGTGTDGERPGVLDLVAALHPTPAVCGTPDQRALDVIRAVEGRGARGLFGGAVGWCDGRGGGAFRVTIRGAVLAEDGRSAEVWAGGGLTAGSDPEAELQETVAKLARARQGLAAGGALGSAAAPPAGQVAAAVTA